jgi:hypothetical protein
MANPYIGANITGCNSPTIGQDRSTYTAIMDALASAIDNHDHSTGKGKQIPTTGIADATVTTLKIADLNVTTAKIADNAVTAAKIAAGAVGLAQLAASNTAITASCGSFSSIAPASVLVTNLSQALTVQSASNYVRITLVPDSVGDSLLTTAGGLTIELWKDGAKIQTITPTTSGAFSPGGIVFEDLAPTAAIHTYAIKVTQASGGVQINNIRMRVTEMK